MTNLTSLSQIYIIDFLNVFSDFREVKYKKHNNIDFHSVKHINKQQDTIDFFNVFFTKYIKYINININSNFIFVLKKITNYDCILYKIIELYKNFNIRFIVIESKFDVDILDKNKDDFLCQYIFSFLMYNNNNCNLISNDKYRDRKIYVSKFSMDKIGMLIHVIKRNNITNSIDHEEKDITLKDNICKDIITKVYKRCTIPKNKLQDIM